VRLQDPATTELDPAPRNSASPWLPLLEVELEEDGRRKEEEAGGEGKERQLPF